MAGAMAPIMHVWQSPTNESRSTSVSLEPRNGTCALPMSRPRMHSLSASSDLLISAPCAHTRTEETGGSASFPPCQDTT
eukprot:4639305-Pleurochrysis_carterae.AAC.2